MWVGGWTKYIKNQNSIFHPKPFGCVVFGSCRLLDAVVKMAATGAGSIPCCIPDRLQPRSVFSRLKFGVGG